jgi:hypothetical protein
VAAQQEEAMYRGASLASTGVGVVFFGTHIEMGWLIGMAITAIVIGCLTYRVSTRSRRIGIGE